MSRRFILIFATLLLCPAWAHQVSGQTASRVIRLIDQRCANCHRNPAADRKGDVEGAPEWTTVRQMAPETILQAVTKGAMRVHAEDVADEVKRAMAEYISGRKLAPLSAGVDLLDGDAPDRTSRESEAVQARTAGPSSLT